MIINLSRHLQPQRTTTRNFLPLPQQMLRKYPNILNFAQSYVEEKIKAWQAKDPYETVDEYKARVTEATRDTKVKELLAEAEKKYISTYTAMVSASAICN